MTENKDADVQENADTNLPAFIKAAPELIPLWDWWVKEGKSTLTMIAVAALAVLGFYGVRGHLKSRDAIASDKVMTASTAEDLAAAVGDCGSLFGTSKVATPLRFRLAKEHFDAGRYQEALDVYEALAKDNGKDAPFAAIANLGRAYSLEGLKKFKEAGEAFSGCADDESKANAGFRLVAKLGMARCKAQQGDVDGATADLETLKAKTEDGREKMLVENTISILKHYDFSRVDAKPVEAFTLPESNAALPLPEVKPAPAPAAKPAPVPAAKPAPAPAAKPAPVPAAKPAPAPAAKPAPAPAAKPAPAPAAKK